eukprot:CAMPEP_0182868334 /NCGR_PEP_ID=MMETSP0034_2-20130328/9250_1 /TAXON_ID=156128 /ORGANISM="Nephroselmis pyriformis, Strain CCMP717" /LENGTH=112 /DNA_ID=CAMNT_0025000731 /DNA_START=65 /DNA_END=403 /DNA_ORIENTATION=+
MRRQLIAIDIFRSILSFRSSASSSIFFSASIAALRALTFSSHSSTISSSRSVVSYIFFMNGSERISYASCTSMKRSLAFTSLHTSGWYFFAIFLYAILISPSSAPDSMSRSL